MRRATLPTWRGPARCQRVGRILLRTALLHAFRVHFARRQQARRRAAARDFVAGARALGGLVFAPMLHSFLLSSAMFDIVSPEPVEAWAAGLAWYRANFQVERFAAVRPALHLPKLGCPVMGVWSSRDQGLLEPQMLVSAQFVQEGLWRYERVEGAGHWVPRDAPQELNRLLLDFLPGYAARDAKL